MTGLLDSVTVLDLASVGPAVRASGWLADYGAAVIKVGPLRSAAGAQLTPKPHLYSGGRGTRQVSIDLKAPAGRETFLRLAEQADVIIESFRPGVVDRLGIGYDDVKGRNRQIVYCSTTGYGQTGPRATWAGHDLNYLAASGFLAASERLDDPDGGKPALPGASIADGAGGGMHAVMAILAALVARASTGEGVYLDVAVADGVLALMALAADDFLVTGAPQRPATAPLQDRFAWYDAYRCADGRWLTVAAIEPKFWANLCRALDLDRWIGAQHDATAQGAIRADLTATFARKPCDEWIALLAPHDTCVAPVLTIDQAIADPHVTGRGAIARAHPASGDDFNQLAPLLAGAERLPRYDLPDRSVSATDDVLAELGFSSDEIAGLHSEGAIE